jgi:hypothetical protein
LLKGGFVGNVGDTPCFNNFMLWIIGNVPLKRFFIYQKRHHGRFAPGASSIFGFLI